jgi:UDP-glucose 4-epimerase
MRILITGGFGYLGGRLSQLLTSENSNEIILGSRYQTSPPKWLPKVRLVSTQWDSLHSLEKSCRDVDAVVHLAGMNAQDCSDNPVAALELNAVATARLLQAAIRQGVKRFIYLSTAHVYVSPLTGIITEDICPISLNSYATSHRAGEDVVRAANQRGEIEGVVIRLSNAYGAPVHKDANCWMLLLNDLCRQAVTTKHMALQSSGLQRRDFIPLSDACRAIDHLLHLPTQKLTRDIFNVGGGWVPTIWEAACLAQERCHVILGFRPQLTCISQKEDKGVAMLDYRSDALHQTGFQSIFNRVEEVDQLLHFCKTSFLAPR